MRQGSTPEGSRRRKAARFTRARRAGLAPRGRQHLFQKAAVAALHQPTPPADCSPHTVTQVASWIAPVGGHASRAKNTNRDVTMGGPGEPAVKGSENDNKASASRIGREKP